ncbi:hypothetical protein DE146DRAFT_659407 [Phaeosphaeria sp. MPI-PUGE-AT-0046c]|nr:hypothetical protein DE146DRAFT_659407 [Phaeosphaeria sp. MPI-PUGE-AT-0046c]
MAMEASMEDKVDHGYATAINPPPTRSSRLHQTSKIVALIIALWVFLNASRLYGYASLVSEEGLFLHNNNDIVLSSAESLLKSYNRPKPQYTFCDYTDGSIKIATEFNITDGFHFLDLSPPQDARGRIKVQRGSDAQIADVEVSVTVAYASPDLPVVSSGFDARTSTMRLSYMSTKCVQVSVELSLRPDVSKGLRNFSMNTQMLDLWWMYSTTWTIDNLLLHSSHGQIDFEGSLQSEPLITHNVSVSSVTGVVSGDYVADANLHFRNEAGPIFIILVPRIYSNVPMALERIDASTDSGMLDIRILAEQMELWPLEPYTHTTQIRSESGPIRASVPLGTLTNYTSEKGNIAATVVPVGSASGDASKDFRTESNQGNMYVHVYNTLQESMKDGRFDPLLSLRSRHQIRNGTMTVRYPYSWYGELEGVASDGSLKLDGSRLKDVQKGENWVKATRGEGMSFMESWVHHGDLDIKVGLGP